MNRESKRRSFFGRSSLSALAGLQSSNDESEPANLLRKRRTASLMTNLSAASQQPEDEDGNTMAGSPASPARAPGSRGSGNRASSAFGSLKGLRVRDDSEEPLSATSTLNKTLSTNWTPTEDTQRNRQVLHHGEVQTSSSMFRKKKEYLVLTETHLMRFKNQQKAAEAFPTYVLV